MLNEDQSIMKYGSRLINACRSILRPVLGWHRRQAFLRFWTGRQNVQWLRVVMNQEIRKLINNLQLDKLKVLEISGSLGRTFKGFKDYKWVDYPEYDICESPLKETFDLIIAEQVFEHLLWPYRAGVNVYQMLNPGGYFLITTPFLIALHNNPVDCTRWTETGLKYFLAECGFPLTKIKTGSWGNRACVKANLEKFVSYRSRIHSLRNEYRFPISVWALAQK